LKGSAGEIFISLKNSYVKVHSKKEVVFVKENIIVRFSAETVLQEYEDLINRELLKVFEE